MIQHRDPGDESEAAMTDEREKKERVFEWFALLDRDSNLEAVDVEKGMLREFAEALGMFDGFKILPCRVILEDEP